VAFKEDVLMWSLVTRQVFSRSPTLHGYLGCDQVPVQGLVDAGV
jgi:hypothetical protein